MGWRISAQRFSGVRGLDFTKLGEEHRAMILTQEICFSIRISCCIFKRGGLKVEWFASDVENDAKFPTFWPPVIIGGGVEEIFIPIVKALPTTEPSEYIWWPSTARLLSAVDWQKKRRKKVHGSGDLNMCYEYPGGEATSAITKKLKPEGVGKMIHAFQLVKYMLVRVQNVFCTCLCI